MKSGYRVVCLLLVFALSVFVPALWAQDEAPAPVSDDDAQVSMYYAVQNGEPETLAGLLKSNPKAVNLKDGELLLAAVSMNAGPDVVKMLLEAGADANLLQKDSGNTCLHLALAEVRDEKDTEDVKAANAKLLETVKLLVAKGAKAAVARSSDGFTPLLLAAKSETVRKAFFDALFEAKDIDVNAKSNAGANSERNYSALFYVVTRNQIEGNDNKEIVDLLLAKGADLKAITGADQEAGRKMWNVLHLACTTTGDRADIVEALLAKGMDIETMADSDMSPLHIAMLANNPKICTLLLQKGAKIESKNSDGVDILSHAKGFGKDKHLESADVVINWKK